MAVWGAPERKSICIIRYGTHRKNPGLPCYFFLSKFSLSLQNLVLLYLITFSNRNNVFSYAWSLNKTLESKQLWSGKLHFTCLTNPEAACLEQDEHMHIQMDNKTQLHLAWHARAGELRHLTLETIKVTIKLAKSLLSERKKWSSWHCYPYNERRVKRK